MSTATKRPPQFSCEANEETLAASDRIKARFGIVKKFQLQRGLALLENSLTDAQSAPVLKTKKKGKL